MTHDGGERRVELGLLDQTVAFHLSIAATLSLQTFLESLGDRPRNARYVILLLLRLNPGITLAELSRTNFRDKSSMSPIIKEFIADGLVRREPIKIGSRPAQALFLTDAGEALCARLEPFAEQHTNQIRDILGVKQEAELVRLLKLLADGLSG